MNLAYFRKSNFDLDETLANLKDNLEKSGMKILGETKLNSNSVVIHACNPDWLKSVISADENLVGLIPCSFVAVQAGDTVSVGVGNPAVLGSVSQHPEVLDVVAQAEDKIKQIIHGSAGVGELKPKSIKLYSTTTCPYCNMEKAWLESRNIEHEYVLVDRDQDAAQEMVQKTGQMGVPVTEVVYENEDAEYIVGFDKHRLASIFGVKA